ncbi:MAG: S8/S53 family peptidase [Anaerolineae bacterium]
MPASAAPASAETPVAACAITPSLLGGQGFSLAGQGFSLAGQGFSLAGQGFSLAGQGFSLAGQGLDPLAVAAEIRDNPVTTDPQLKWIDDRLDFFISSMGFNNDSTAILVIDEFNTPDAHGFEVRQILDKALDAVRARVPDIKIAAFNLDISASSYDAEVIATAISDKVNELRGDYRNFVLNMSFGLISCEDTGPIVEGTQLPAFNFEQALAVVNANNQESPSLAITPVLECVAEVGGSGGHDDGENGHRSRDHIVAHGSGPKYVAYFSYKNENDQLINIAVGNNNKFSPWPKDRSQPTQFEPGRQSFVFAVPFDSGNLVWTLVGPDGQSRTAIASRYSPRCEQAVPAPTQKITPIAECVADLGDGRYSARFGYNNPNALGSKVPVGSGNKFLPSPYDRGQVTTFVPGLHQAVFAVEFNGNDLKWILNGITVTANKRLPACAEPQSFGLANYLTQNLEIPQNMLGQYWNHLASAVKDDELQPLRVLLRNYLSDSAAPLGDFSATAIASSGNLRPWLGPAPLAPASWPETIAVGATLGDTTNPWQFSQDANVMAPGAGYMVAPNSYYAGTSFSAPVFSTLVGLCATIPDALTFDGTNPPLEPPVLDASGNKILTNSNIATDDMAPLACHPPAVITVGIDVKPDSPSNRINLKSWGKLSVAILSSDTFDATQVNPVTVTLAGALVIIKNNGRPFADFKDVNHDRKLDLVVWVSIRDLQLDENSTEAILIGMTFGGQAIQGSDKVSIVQNHAPELESPKSGSTTSKKTVKLEWEYEDTEDDAATCFLVQIDDQSDFVTPVQSSTVVRSESYTTPSLKNGIYYWRVAVSDCVATAITPWSETWSFTVKTSK